MISQIPAAAIGTEIWVGMPARPSAAPMPTKSEMQIPRLAISTALVAKHRPADSVLLAHELGQTLAGDHAHARREHLHERQRDRDQHDRPQQLVAVLRADRGVGRDPAGVVAGVGRDQTRAEQAQEGEHTCAARAKARRQTWSATGGRPDPTHDGRYSDRHRTDRLEPSSSSSLFRRRARVRVRAVSPRRADRSACASRAAASPRAHRRR